MKTICLLVLSVHVLLAQGLTIGSGTTLSLGSATLSLTGNWSNSGTFAAENGTIIFNGTGTQIISNSAGETFKHLTVNKTSGDVQLVNNITVNGNLTLTSGDLDMNGDTVSLGGSAVVSETAGNTVKGNGIITGTMSLNAPSSVNPFGLGATISSAANLGTTTITRGHAVQTGGSQTSISRYYDISPTNNSGLNATLVFAYDQSELNGKIESELVFFKSIDGGTSWAAVNGTVDTSSNTVSVTGINDFSRWTLGSASAPLPVELASFSAATQRLTVELRWKTTTEVNNYGFDIEKRMKDEGDRMKLEESFRWEKIGFVEGHGTTNSPKEYSFTDSKLKAGKYFYRLKQIDRDGTFSYSQKIEVTVGAVPKVFQLEQNYPNPFNPTTTITFTLADDGLTILKIYDILGREVETLVNEELKAGQVYRVDFNGSNLSSGIYFYKLESNRQSVIKKFLLMK